MSYLFFPLPTLSSCRAHFLINAFFSPIHQGGRALPEGQPSTSVVLGSAGIPETKALRDPSSGARPLRTGCHPHGLGKLRRKQQAVATHGPPEDQDGSGDDADNFSGSGAGALHDVTVSHQTPSTWQDVQPLMTTPPAPEPTGTDAITAPTSTPTAVQGPREEGVAVAHAEAGPDLTAQEEATRPPSEPTQHPATHRASAARAATSQAPTTPGAHGDAQPGHPETAAPGLEAGGPATERAAEDGASDQLPAGEGSGEEDFTFDTSGESVVVATRESVVVAPGGSVVVAPVEPSNRSQLPGEPVTPEASQSLLDKKEILGGVIAGGLGGLIFAVCLVGFMLYRMKKKDEGSYSLEEPKQANGGAYQKPTKQEEFYA
ncbi:syndecan-1 isoform X1 [Dasypus novemcinctus]|uniref:syndecan-1 isoform X1 n=1 Tax=Dasypus novemcinctus TaxID=9361 RepID=UPI0039C91948